MGTVYCGPYAEQIGYEHEGYAARIRPSGTLTSDWSGESADVVAYIAACGCGWTGRTHHAATDDGVREAVAEWDRTHMQPLIEFAWRSWRAWADRVATRARYIAQQVTDGNLASAELVMERLTDDVTRWSQTFRALVDETDVTES